ncbi:unnamed protein product [Rotaria sp. Silwood2]|nr:unnamed protein product [Rotaria sp. Silwood2]
MTIKGRVASFYGCELRKYTGFRVSTTSDIRSILSITEGPLILTSDSLSLYTRQGLNIFHHSKFLDMDSTNDAPYALDYSESMAFFNSAYNPTSAQSITATEFDIAQELLWAGSNEV